MTNQEIEVGMRIDAKGKKFTVTGIYGNEIELDEAHFVTLQRLQRDIETGRTEVLEQ